MKKRLLLIMAVQFSVTLFSQTVIPLYNGAIPNTKKVTGREQEPVLTVFLPARANGTAVIICPGGGYVNVVMKKEGDDVAKVLNEWGITAFVLKYRLPNDSTMQQKETGPLQDAQRAIQLVRSRAAEWKINTSKVGIMGFSAGGHLAATLGTHFNKAVIANKPRINLRPDFMILAYPVISFVDSLAHQGSKIRLLGNNPSQDKVKQFSNELHVTRQTPPTFLVHGKDDKTIKVENSTVFYNALQKKHVPAEIHLYEKGPHGFGFFTTGNNNWTGWLKTWLQKLKLLE